MPGRPDTGALQRLTHFGLVPNERDIGGGQARQTEFLRNSGRDLDVYFDRWIYGSSLPRLKFSYTTEPGAIVVRIEQIGERFELPVTVTIKQGASSTDVTIPVLEQVTTTRIPVTSPVRSVAVNEDDAAPAVFVR